MTKFIIETWGCQMNEYDSQKMNGILKKSGFEEAESEDDADVFILNTCSVREKAAHKIFTRLGVLNKKYKEGRIVGVCGCVASQEGKKLFSKNKNLNFVLGTRSVHLIADAISKAMQGKRFLNTNDNPESLEIPYSNINRQGKTKAFVSIMEGCNNFCTYCVVPFTRGRERSRPMKDIVQEIEFSVKNDSILEVELLGQNVNSYDDGDHNFKDLLKAVSTIEGLLRIRFMTSHPKDFDEELVEIIKQSDKICNFIHLPLQSGSDSVLKKMGRKYTSQEYMEKIHLIRKHLPDAVISSDFIVGFPGETEEDFYQTMEVIHTVKFDNLYSFKYSPRPNTAALKLKDQEVPDEIAGKRLYILQKAQENIQLVKHNSLIGKELEILVESVSKKNPKRLSGRTEGNHIVNFSSGRGESLIGKTVHIRVVSGTMASLSGELV